MSDRRRDPLFQAGSPAYHRIMERMEHGLDAFSDRMEGWFERVDKRIDRIDRDLAGHEQENAVIRGELAGLKLDLGELRDAASLGAEKTVAAVVAAGATAEAAAEALKPVVAWHRTAWGRVLIAASGFTTMMMAADNVPDAVRGWDKLWSYLRNEPPGVARAAEVEK